MAGLIGANIICSHRDPGYVCQKGSFARRYPIVERFRLRHIWIDCICIPCPKAGFKDYPDILKILRAHRTDHNRCVQISISQVQPRSSLLCLPDHNTKRPESSATNHTLYLVQSFWHSGRSLWKTAFQNAPTSELSVQLRFTYHWLGHQYCRWVDRAKTEYSVSNTNLSFPHR